uniref:Uncharacterized protein n=1 Tax=Arundo donax TaxID=35708 RepID=A0A0A9AKR1_ARUDO
MLFHPSSRSSPLPTPLAAAVPHSGSHTIPQESGLFLQHHTTP